MPYRKIPPIDMIFPRKHLKNFLYKTLKFIAFGVSILNKASTKKFLFAKKKKD